MFVGNLSHQVSNKVLTATFQEFCDQSIKDDMKVRVVLDASNRQSKGYGFVSFPVRRAAELALICMQEFELYGRVIQLGWGQEENNVSATSLPTPYSSPLSLAPSATVSSIQPSSVSLVHLSSATVDLIQPSDVCITPSLSAGSHVASPTPNKAALATVRELVKALPALRRVPSAQAFATNGNEQLEAPTAKKLKTGHKISDTLFPGRRKDSKSETLLAKKSRWDQETRIRAAHSDFGRESRALGDSYWSLDNKTTSADIAGELQLQVTQAETRESQPELEGNPRDSLSLSKLNENTNLGDFCPVEVSCYGVCTGESQNESKSSANTKEHAMTVDDKAASDELKVKTSFVAAVGKPVNESGLEHTSTTCHPPSVRSNDQEPSTSEARKEQDVPVAKKLQWVTREQKVELLKLVCTRLRAVGVTGHVGVFGLHYEADNRRLYVVCAKHVTEAELVGHFAQFGAAEVKLNRDPKGASKGCAFVHYVNPSDATTALRNSHGQVLGGLPLKVMIAEPKSRTGSKKSTRNT